jgi:alpha-galactosidase
MISDDLTRASASSRATLTNGEVIAIDQDPAGVQGRLVSTAGSGQVWVRPLSGGARAVALLNRSGTATRISTSAAAIGMPPGGGYVLRDVWTHSTRVSASSISAVVGGDSSVLLRVSQTA